MDLDLQRRDNFKFNRTKTGNEEVQKIHVIASINNSNYPLVSNFPRYKIIIQNVDFSLIINLIG